MAYTIGVIADTHIPDRVTELHPRVLPIFREAGVQHILHAGDICSSRPLQTLAELAPVSAVSGNRDLLLPQLKSVEQLTLGGVRIALLHGHGTVAQYLWDKWQFWFWGYRLKRYLPLLDHAGASAQVIVFGHTHHPETTWHNGKLLFNPGSASTGYLGLGNPSVGLLHIEEDGSIRAEVVKLEGFQIQQRQWAAS